MLRVLASSDGLQVKGDLCGLVLFSFIVVFVGCLENDDLENDDLENDDLENDDLENDDLENDDLENDDLENDLTFFTQIFEDGSQTFMGPQLSEPNGPPCEEVSL